MSLVIDATLTRTWYFEDEATLFADEILSRRSDAGAWVSSTWRLEVANAFALAPRHRRLEAVYRDASLDELTLMPINIDTDTSTYAWSMNRDLRAAAPALNIELLDAA